MNHEILAGNLRQINGSILERWDKLTNNDLEVATCLRDKLIAIIQERYGLARDEVELQFSEFEDHLKIGS